jgi:hypothetical protein
MSLGRFRFGAVSFVEAGDAKRRNHSDGHSPRGRELGVGRPDSPALEMTLKISGIRNNP